MKKIFALLITILFIASCAKSGDVATSDEPAETMTEATAAYNKIETLIRKNLDLLAKDEPDAYDLEPGTIDNKFFNEIVAFGEDALPLLKLIANRDYYELEGYEEPNEKREQRWWAVQAIYAIKPDIYDLIFPSSDKKYTAKVKVNSFNSIFNHGISFNDIHIIEYATNKIIYKTDMSKTFHIGGLFWPAAIWSSDNRFVVIECCGRRSGTVMAIDMLLKKDIILPEAKEAMEIVFKNEKIKPEINVPRYWFSFDKWESEKIVKIKYGVGEIFNGEYDVDNKNFHGWYTYDLVKKEIVNFDYTFDYED